MDDVKNIIKKARIKEDMDKTHPAMLDTGIFSYKEQRESFSLTDIAKHDRMMREIHAIRLRKILKLMSIEPDITPDLTESEEKLWNTISEAIKEHTKDEIGWMKDV